MANTIVKRQYTKLLNANNDLEIEHFETDADVVLVNNSTGHYGGSATNAQSALEELYNRNEIGVITLGVDTTSGTLTDDQAIECAKPFAMIRHKQSSVSASDFIYVKDQEGSSDLYPIGPVTFTAVRSGYTVLTDGEPCLTYYYIIVKPDKTWELTTTTRQLYYKSTIDYKLGLKQDGIPTSNATIADDSSGVVKIKKGITQFNGAISNSGGSDITLGTAAKKAFTTSVTQNSSDLVTSGAVWTVINNLPEPMVFKGTLGTNGTITGLPTASSTNEGFVYKVITAGTYASTAAKVGDTFVCAKPEGASSYSWILIPSGDDVEDTWREIQVNGSQALGSGISTGAVNFKNGTGTFIYSGDGDNAYDITVNLADAYGDTKNPYASKTKNYVLAAPSTADGAPVFRALVAADIPHLSDYQLHDDNLTEIAGLTGNGFLKKTGPYTWSFDGNTYLTGNQTITVSGDATGSGTTSIALTLANSGVTAGTYTAVTVNAKGLVTAGAQTIEFGTSGQTTPSASLAVGGIFLKMI